MVRLLTERGLAVGGRCSPASGPTTNWRQAGSKTQNDLLAAMESFANEGGLISEQVWDSPDIPERELHFGRPSGSAMPLVWAHAEYLKLRRSLRDGRRIRPAATNRATLSDRKNRIPAHGVAV